VDVCFLSKADIRLTSRRGADGLSLAGIESAPLPSYCGGMRKPAAWTSVAVGVAWIVLGSIQFAYHIGPLPRGLFLGLGVIYVISAVLVLRQAYEATRTNRSEKG
jgi:hypothetical protein